MTEPDNPQVVQGAGSGKTPPFLWLIIWAIWDGAGLLYFALAAQSENASGILEDIGIIPIGLWLIGSIVLLALAIRSLMLWSKQRRALNPGG